MRSLPVPVARILDAAEGKLDLGAYRRSVDVSDPRLDIPDRPEGAVHVLRIDLAREPITGIIQNAYGVVEIGRLENGKDGTEYLLLCDPRIRRDLGGAALREQAYAILGIGRVSVLEEFTPCRRDPF